MYIDKSSYYIDKSSIDLDTNVSLSLKEIKFFNKFIDKLRKLESILLKIILVTHTKRVSLLISR